MRDLESDWTEHGILEFVFVLFNELKGIVSVGTLLFDRVKTTLPIVICQCKDLIEEDEEKWT